jgi:hypothetical protein
MATARKKTTTRRKADTMPANNAVPAGFKQLGGGYADSWNPEPGDVLIGSVTGEIRSLEVKRGRKTVTTRVMEVTEDETGKRYSVWDSATLSPLFDELQGYDGGPVGTGIYIKFDGLGKSKGKGMNPPKLFTVAIAE